MKRAKIMLTALVVLAFTGGALAFKAQNTFGADLRCTFLPGIDPTVTVITSAPCTQQSYTTDVGGTIGFCTFTYIQNANEPCYKLRIALEP